MNQLLKKFGIKDIAKNNMNQIEGISWPEPLKDESK